MNTLLIILFLIGYAAIALEHRTRVNKAAVALLMGGSIWTVLMLMELSGPQEVLDPLSHHLAEISEIIFFLLGAITIVELIDTHEGFNIITDRIRSQNRVKLIWMVGLITFFFSALLDNLTTSIVMAAMIKRLMNDKKDWLIFGSIVVIAANAGGAWSPIGDVTTIMLWIGGQVSATNIMYKLIIPSLVSVIVPLTIMSTMAKGSVVRKKLEVSNNTPGIKGQDLRPLVLFTGICGLLFVPLFKTYTHLPPYVGMLISLSVLWIMTELLLRRGSNAEGPDRSVAAVLQRIDTPTILFFLGILLAVGGLQASGLLDSLARTLNNTFGNVLIYNSAIGVLSGIVDNVPLVAATMQMYPISYYHSDHMFWELLAYCAGTGGSLLIIGSAAGVAIMGILRIDFMWYLRMAMPLALAGYISGIITYWLLFN